tara:strand:- start:47550 stop:47921 length:372 start_codon:yes stop_codon:yes gene_type:complete
MSIRKNMTVRIPLYRNRISGELTDACPEGMDRYNVRAVEMWRAPNQEDYERWAASDASKGMDSAGETKLPPSSIYARDRRETEFKVVRGRVKARRGYYDIPSCVEVVDSEGVRWFVEKKYIVA